MKPLGASFCYFEIMKHELHLHPRPFKAIVNGEKTIECRLLDEKRQTIAIDDTLEFTNRDDKSTIEVRVKGLLKHKSFRELFNDNDLSKFGSDMKTVDELDLIMLDYYSLKEQFKYGVLGIEFEVIK